MYVYVTFYVFKWKILITICYKLKIEFIGKSMVEFNNPFPLR